MIRFTVRESFAEVSRICSTAGALPVPDPGDTLAHCTSVRAVHVQLAAVVTLNAKLPPRDVTCPGTPDALVLHVDGLGDGDGVGDGEDGVPLLSLLHATIRNSNVKGTSRPKVDRVIAGDAMHEVRHPTAHTGCGGQLQRPQGFAGRRTSNVCESILYIFDECAPNPVTGLQFLHRAISKE